MIRPEVDGTLKSKNELTALTQPTQYMLRGYLLPGDRQGLL